MSSDIRQAIEITPFVDTHEHLWEESTRIETLDGPVTKPRPLPAPDFGLLFSNYANADLEVAGMPAGALEKLFSYTTSLDEKWAAVEPYYERARHTGYLQNVRESVRMLYGEDDIHRGNYDRISEKLRTQIRPGFYEFILRDVAKVEYAQVNALDTPVFRVTEHPALLAQDLSFLALALADNLDEIAALANRNVSSLKDWHEIIDWCFATYGPRAIAVKNQAAYGRGLDYDQVSAADAAPVFEKFLRDPNAMSMQDKKPFQDHLFHYCVDKAAEYKLPVKLHTGYYAGQGYMPLNRLRHNAGDLCELLMAHKDANFLIMHVTYPYQDEAIAIAKHYPNAYVDMCWAWIINPIASVRFLKEFITAAPVNKLFTFGGDYGVVELVPGHARIARHGLGQAVNELYEEGWIEREYVKPLIDRLMRGNANELFDYPSRLAAWKTKPKAKAPATAG